ncbi:hypothetical protein JCM8208_001577 [Rhodotorula glutinis]
MSTEDAAVLLADFVSSLDNLPSEVCHILEEISHKEGRVSDLRSRALQRDQAIQKHARPVAQGGQGLLVPNVKEESSTKKIKLDLENAEITTKEKVALSERGVNLLSRHLNRLQAQLELLTSSVPPLPTLPSFAPNMAAATPAALSNAQPAYTGTPGGAAYNSYMPYGTPGTPGYADKRKTSAGQVPLLPAQMKPNPTGLANGGYAFANSPGGGATPGTPLGASGGGGARRGGGGAGPSRLANVAYASPGPGTPHGLGGHHAQGGAGQHGHPHAHHQQQQQQQQHLGHGQHGGGAHGQQGQPPNLAFLQQQQQMQQQQLRIAQQQAQHLAQQQLASQAQMAQLQAAQQRGGLGGGGGAGGGGASGMSQQMAQHGAALAAHLAATGGGGGGGSNKRKRGDEERKVVEEVETEIEGEDLTPYCFCQRPSFGEMIGCDAPDCKIEWFHLNCIGLKESPEGSWYCSQCEPRMKAQGRGGRKR